MQKSNLLIVGSIGLDTIETTSTRVDRVLGGAASYSACSACHFTPTAIVGVVGDDFPPEHEEMLRSKSIDLTCMEKQPGKTFFWHGRYEDDMNIRETLDTQLGVFAEFSPKIPASHAATPYLFLANIHPQLQLDVLNAMQGNPLVAADTMNLWIDTTPDLLKKVIERVDIMFINDEEARMITGRTTIPKAADAIRAMGPKAAVVKRGDAGVMVFYEDDIFCLPAVPITANDPTGAGDAFAGGMMGYIASQGALNKPILRQSAVMGTVMASLTVEDFSLNRLVKVNADDIRDRVERLRSLTSFE
ncbi:MAG: sugar kinase [Candidatus Omnitrophica bacterium]|nr:sugar kinase [Candidatus Omnitrophota bacterium]